MARAWRMVVVALAVIALIGVLIGLDAGTNGFIWGGELLRGWEAARVALTIVYPLCLAGVAVFGGVLWLGIGWAMRDE